MLNCVQLNLKDIDEEQYILSDFREKMVGANLYEGSVEGAFESWLEKVYLE